MSNPEVENLASGSQDLAALAGLFCTDGVEQHALAVQNGCLSTSVCSLSLIGILGLLRSSVKLGLGLKACCKAGFSLDSLRPIFGYLADESPSTGVLRECYDTHFFVSPDNTLHFHKGKAIFGDATRPILQVGAHWEEGLAEKTLLNLGNPSVEYSWQRHLVFGTSAAIVCSGLTAWALTIVSAPWTWIKVMAIPMLNIFLLALVAIPLWLDWQINRPIRHISPAIWDALNGRFSPHLPDFWLLQVCVNGGDVLHPQGNTTLIHSWLLKILVFVATAGSIVGYLCQYAVLKSASTRQTLYWICVQGSFALLRPLAWIIDPSLDDPHITQTEYAMVNNSASSCVTLMDLVCTARTGKHHVPLWAWKYVSETPLREILGRAPKGRQSFLHETEAARYVFTGFDWPRIVARRRSVKAASAEEAWTIGLIKYKESREIKPFVLIRTTYQTKVMDPNTTSVRIWGWMETTNGGTSREDKSIKNACSLFFCSESGERLHVTSKRVAKLHRCSWPTTSGYTTESQVYEVYEDSWKFHECRGPKVEQWIADTLELPGKERKYNHTTLYRHAANTWDADTLVTATENTLTRKNYTMSDHTSRIDGYHYIQENDIEAVEKEYPERGYPAKGIDLIRKYIELGQQRYSQQSRMETGFA